MLIYLLIYFILCINVLVNLTYLKNIVILNKLILNALIIILILFIGLRNEIGPDWFTYLHKLDGLNYYSLSDVFSSTEPAYSVLNWIGANTNTGIYLVNSLCGVFLITGIVSLGKNIGDIGLTILCSYPYLIVVVGLGLTRQSAAIGLLMCSFRLIKKNKLINYIILITLAMAFHTSAIINIILPIFSYCKIQLKYITSIIMLVFVIFILLNYTYTKEIFHYYISSFVNSDYQSKGAGIRIMIVTVSGVLYILFNKKFTNLNYRLNKYLLIYSYASLLFPILLFNIQSSVGLDRLCLYWLPLSIVTLVSLTSCIINIYKRLILILFIIIYNLLILIVWLNYSDNKYSYMPYKSILIKNYLK
jgi:hypothetical protein